LYVVHHESLEIWFGKFVFEHCVAYFFPHDRLHFSVFRLHVVNFHGHDFVICQIIYMENHYCLANDALNIVKHYKEFLDLPQRN
jgi:hypothetical protein